MCVCVKLFPRLAMASRDGFVYKVYGLTLARPNCETYRLDFSSQDQIMGKSQKCFQLVR